MGQADYFLAGSFNRICHVCGFKYKAHQVRVRWDNALCCDGPGTNQCWEMRHPQDFVRGRADRQSVPRPSPDPTPIFVPSVGGDLLLDDAGDYLVFNDAGDPVALE